MSQFPDIDTDYIETLVKEEATKLANTMKGTISNIRPYGTTEVPIEEQEMEYKFMMDYPQLFEQFLEDQGASVESAIRYAHTMEKRMKDVGTRSETSKK